ncbi:MAG TPA: hypothetical protein VF163_03625 [Micromonosporaceae bacterium]
MTAGFVADLAAVLVVGVALLLVLVLVIAADTDVPGEPAPRWQPPAADPAVLAASVSRELAAVRALAALGDEPMGQPR